MSTKKGFKNYVILAIIFITGMAITLYLCNWYNVFSELERQTPVIRGTFSEITSEELEHFILENPTVTVYMCTSSNDICRNYEKKLVKFVSTKDLSDAVVYLNLSNVDEEEFIIRFNEKYPYKIKLTKNFPAFVTFEDGKIKYILQENDNNRLTIVKTKQYFELNHIGE